MAARLTTDLLALDIRPLARKGHLKMGNSSTVTWTRGSTKNSIAIKAAHSAVTLNYTTQGIQQSYGIHVTQTPCHLGGQRHWWLCPRCDKRCAILYGGAVFICRKCAGLHYPIQHASEFSKAIIHAEKIRNRLGWIPGIAHGYGPKPKGMHWRTYQKYTRIYKSIERQSILNIELQNQYLFKNTHSNNTKSI